MGRQRKETIEEANIRRRDEARAEYRLQGKILFAPYGDGDISRGEKLLLSLREQSEILKSGKCPLDQFEGLDTEVLEKALTLEGYVTYELETGPSDGTDAYTDAIDEGFEEARLRDRIVFAFEDLCRNAGCLARELGSVSRNGFTQGLLQVRDLEDGGCSYKTAEGLLRNVYTCLRQLWADCDEEFTLHKRDEKSEEVMRHDDGIVKGKEPAQDMDGTSSRLFKINLDDRKVTIGAGEPFPFSSWQFLFLVLSLNGFEAPHKIWLERVEVIDKSLNEAANEAVNERYKWLSAYREKKEGPNPPSAESVRDVLKEIRYEFKKKFGSNSKILVVPSGSPERKNYKSVNVGSHYDLLWCWGKEASHKCPEDLRKVLQFVS